MSTLYWARYGFLFLMAAVIIVIIYAHLRTTRSR
jgi:hypothetical protein